MCYNTKDCYNSEKTCGEVLHYGTVVGGNGKGESN